MDLRKTASFHQHITQKKETNIQIPWLKFTQPLKGGSRQKNRTCTSVISPMVLKWQRFCVSDVKEIPSILYYKQLIWRQLFILLFKS